MDAQYLLSCVKGGEMKENKGACLVCLVILTDTFVVTRRSRDQQAMPGVMF
jgi:hypothetical protein